MVFSWRDRAIEPVAVSTPRIIALVEINGDETILRVSFGHIEISASAIGCNTIGFVFKGEEQIIFIQRIGYQSQILINT